MIPLVSLLIAIVCISSREISIQGAFFNPPGSTCSITLTENLAQGKPTAQSSTHSYGHSKNAVDGNPNTAWNAKSCTHTNKGYGQWWRVDLKRHYAVVKLRITNVKCCLGRLKNFEIRVGESATNPQARNHLCSYEKRVMAEGETRDIVCKQTIIGRYVHVILNQNDYLMLCEVQVFGLGGFSQFTRVI